MRLLTYNIHKGFGGSDRRYRLERVLSVIAALKPDFVCLQEVDQNVRRSHYHDQPSLIARHLGITAGFFQLNVPSREGGYGNLLLSRWPIQHSHRICLRHGLRKPRGAQSAVIATPDGLLHLVNWHLGLAEQERRWQARQLFDHPLFLQSAHLPTVIAGDFNDWRNSLARHHFAGHDFLQATSPARRFRSFPAFLAMASLDKVFYRGAFEFERIHVVKSPLARRASDHLPLVVDFRLNGNTAAEHNGTG